MAYDPSSDNEIGFEWLLMPLIPGRTARNAWGYMSKTAKVAFTKQVAEFEAQLLSASETNHMRGIGTLASPSEQPSHLVSRYWFMGDHFEYDVPRGPFHSSREWLDADLRITKQSMGTYCPDAFDVCLNSTQRLLETTDKLLKTVPTVFPVTDEPEPTTIFHQDLRLENILVDEKGVITAVLDWEFAPAIPRWLAMEMPAFLGGLERLPVPFEDIPSFMHDLTLDDEVNEPRYMYDPMEYEKDQLGKVYTDHMRELRPTWDAEVAGSASKRDLYRTVKLTGIGWIERFPYGSL